MSQHVRSLHICVVGDHKATCQLVVVAIVQVLEELNCLGAGSSTHVKTSVLGLDAE